MSSWRWGSQIAVAARQLGVERLHPEQRQIIGHVVRGGDALAVLPTGYGKSICYQIPSMILEHPVVVVSPLLALLRDQYDRLRRRDVAVVRVDSTLRSAERKEAFERIERGGPLLVMTSLGSDEMKRALERSGVSLLAVDEAHMASEWGHDFRPAYLRLGQLIAQCGRPPVAALTATATEVVRRDVSHILGLRDPLVIVTSSTARTTQKEVAMLSASSDARLPRTPREYRLPPSPRSPSGTRRTRGPV